ncbi:nucleotidyltransferase domain-containing protein [Butyrivibrio sp. WCD3002]|jgi:predicted nucleotidyltransferase|uniref:nucleotidyltransferase domain-containing protein n=1 Tax=Butyrivibrio sp. WCD3002 TaxID=1280676 RepID=UPI00040C9F63|nr:nucleotidyltransferase domain-containing protein [Butyrivibrio sp. WCD3002]
MCKVVSVQIGNRNIKVADIKRKYLENIVASAEECTFIDKIVLFGSSIEDRCTADSDIDIAVFGAHPKGKALTSKQFRRFADRLAEFDDFLQSYDILYFKTGKKDDSAILAEIDKGEVLYVRE